MKDELPPKNAERWHFLYLSIKLMFSKHEIFFDKKMKDGVPSGNI